MSTVIFSSRSFICRQCSRTLSSSSRQGQPQRSATAALSGELYTRDIVDSNPLIETVAESLNRADNRPLSRLQPQQSRSPTLDALEPRSATKPAPRPGLGNAALTKLFSDELSEANRTVRRLEDPVLENQRASRRRDLELQMQRRWKVGEVYAPHDLSGVEGNKWKQLRKKTKQPVDVIDLLGINPLHFYKVRDGRSKGI